MTRDGSRILAGRYRLEDVIGRGGMSTVYRATDQTLGRTVAVKVLLAVLADQDPTYTVRFEREARAVAALSSSAIVTVYDTGVDADGHYIVMEYVAGRSLEEILGDGRLLEISEALRIAGRVAGALASAHAAGILHRDVKPANVMVAGDGAVKVLDFGIARRLDGTTITQAASVVGTAAYMAPERALGEPGDARADVYSLGCLLYAMLTGRPPFTGELSAALLHQQINSEPRPPSELREGVSPAVDGLVLAMLAKEPGARPASAVEVRDRIAGTVPETAASAATVPLAARTAATRPLSAATVPTTRVRAAPTRPGLLADHRRRAVLMALATAAVALIAVALLGRGGSSQHGSTQSAPPATTNAPATTHQATTPKTTSTPAVTPTPTQPPAKAGPTGAPAAGPAPPGHGGKPPGHKKEKPKKK